MLELPPIVIAAPAVLIAFVWLLIGSIVLGGFLKRLIDDEPFAYLLAWVMWPLVAAVPVVGMAMFGGVNRILFAAGTFLLCASGVWEILRGNYFGSVYRKCSVFFAAMPAYLKIVLVLGGIYQLLNIVDAAHPQGLYDHLNYHLSISKHLMQHGGLGSAWDPHMLFTGFLEFNFVWLRSLIDDDLLLMGVAQVMTYLISIPPAILLICFFVKKMDFERTQIGWVFAILLFAMPMSLGDAVIYHVGKPDAYLMIGTLLAFYSLLILRSNYLAFAVMTVLAAAELTVLHMFASMLPVFVLINWRQRDRCRKLVWASLAIVGIFLLKNFLYLGNPVYPVLGKYIGARFTDGASLDYWRSVMFAGETGYFNHLRGLYNLGAKIPLWSGLIIGLLLVHGKSLWGQIEIRRVIITSLFFVAPFSLIWPLLYGSTIAIRFVTPLIAVAILVSVVFLLSIPARASKIGLLIVLLFAIAGSHTGVLLNHLTKWNLGNTEHHMRVQDTSFEPALVVNKIAAELGTVLSNRGVKYFFDDQHLYTDSPMDAVRKDVLREFLEDPSAAASKYKLKSLVKYRLEYKTPNIDKLWSFFEHRGTTVELEGSQVLQSSCYFESLNCL